MMKKFKWRLQRLLDVRQKQEDALRADLAALSEQMAALRGRILMEKAILRNRLVELRLTAPAERLSRQQMFMTYISNVDKKIVSLQEDLGALDVKRKEKTEAVIATRKSRKVLERLREQAWESYCRQADAQQRKEEDERTNAAAARKILERC